MVLTVFNFVKQGRIIATDLVQWERLAPAAQMWSICTDELGGCYIMWLGFLLWNIKGFNS